ALGAGIGLVVGVIVFAVWRAMDYAIDGRETPWAAAFAKGEVLALTAALVLLATAVIAAWLTARSGRTATPPASLRPGSRRWPRASARHSLSPGNQGDTMNDYAGDITADQAWEILQTTPGAVLVDVRTEAEWRFVGVPDAPEGARPPVFVEWVTYPD